MGYTQNVHQGDTLCEIHAAQRGEEGTNVLGAPVVGVKGKEPKSPVGKNTKLNEEGTRLLALCDGSVSVTNGIVSVSDTLTIDGDVDNSTGDITFTGDITINGNVFNGFTVKTPGNITIRGNVEGANIVADGNVVITEGIIGTERGSLTAGGTVRCKYMQGGRVKVGGDLYCETSMNSTIECGGNLEFTGARSRLIGGRAVVSGHVIAGEIGSKSHAPTLIWIHSGGESDQKINELQKRLKEIEEEELKLSQLFARVEDLRQKNRLDASFIPTIELAHNNWKQLNEEKSNTVDALAYAKAEQLRRQTEAAHSYIHCKGILYEGVTIQFGPVNTRVKQELTNHRVMLRDGDIMFIPM
jgi:uncharacterized protein (DUF342 family)